MSRLKCIGDGFCRARRRMRGDCACARAGLQDRLHHGSCRAPSPAHTRRRGKGFELYIKGAE